MLIGLVLGVAPLSSADENKGFEIIKVKKGDTLSKIAKKHLEDPRRWRELLQYNKIPNANLIKPGMELKLPTFLSRRILGVVVFRVGKAEVVHRLDKQWQPLSVSNSLFNQDSVHTLAKSHLHIQVDEKATLKMYPESTLILDKTKFSASVEHGFFLQQGRLNTLVKPGQVKSFHILTPAAVAAVRGTEFETEVDHAKQTTLRCFDGEVEVRAQKRTVRVPAGYGVVVEFGKPPGEVFQLPSRPQIHKDE